MTLRHTDKMNFEAMPVSCDYEFRGETLTLSNIRIAGLDWNLFPPAVQDEALNFLTVVVRGAARRKDAAF